MLASPVSSRDMLIIASRRQPMYLFLIKPTVGIDFLAKNISHHAKSYRLQLWDTAGQERFRSLIPSYLKDAHSAIVVFDVSSKISFAEVPMWLKMFEQNKGGEGTMYLVANKTDLEFRQISFQAGKERADKLGMEYFQISAKTGDNVENLFMNLLQHTSEIMANPSRIRMFRKKDTIKEEVEDQPPNPRTENTQKKIIKRQQIHEAMDASQAIVVQPETGSAVPAPSETLVLKRQVILDKQKQKKQAVQKKQGCCT